MSAKDAVVLCGGPGLGFYVPGAVLARRLGASAEVEVIERLLPADKRELVRKARIRFRSDFRFALMAQRLTSDIAERLDPGAVEQTLSRWRDSDRRHFAVFSGFWLPLVRRYIRKFSRGPVVVDLCHVDASVSASWRLVGEREPEMRDVWFVSWQGRQLNFRLDVGEVSPVDWGLRSGRILVHGGGWGVGTYRARTIQLRQRDMALDVLCYDHAALSELGDGERGFILDPEWTPYDLLPGQSLFPPLGRLDSAGEIRYSCNHEVPELFEVTRRANSIVSKPGGGTLIDSLAGATPLILLEPFGEYERDNGRLWKELGFAMDFEDWAAADFGLDVLEPLHQNLLAARSSVSNYADHCCDWSVGGMRTS